MRQQSALLRDITNVTPQLDHRSRRHIGIIDTNLAARWHHHPVEAAQQRGLAGAALTNQREATSSLDHQ
jgi:hypothetical protein